jgi:hypothetical protein
MLGGRKQNALFHQTGGVTHARDVVALGFDGKVIKIHAPKNDPSLGGSGRQGQVPVHTSVKANSLRAGAGRDGGLEHWARIE